MTTEYIGYPKMVYHDTCRQGRVVPTAAEHDVLGAGWVETPVDLPDAVVVASETDQIATLTAENADLLARVADLEQEVADLTEPAKGKKGKKGQED